MGLRFFRRRIAALIYRDYDLNYPFGRYIGINVSLEDYKQKSMLLYQFIYKTIETYNRFLYNDYKNEYSQRIINEAIEISRTLYLDEPISYSLDYINFLSNLSNKYIEREEYSFAEPLKRELMYVGKARNLSFLATRTAYDLSTTLIKQNKNKEAIEVLEETLEYIDSLKESDRTSLKSRKDQIIELLDTINHGKTNVDI